MAVPVSTPPTIPSYRSNIPKNQGERSISTWKTEPVEDRNGVRYVRVIEGSDGNEERVGRIYEVVRYEFRKQKTIFRDCSHPYNKATPVSTPRTISSSEPKGPDERSISAWKTERADSNGVCYVRIIDGSDGNTPFLNRTYKVVRFEFYGGKVVFDCSRS